MSFETEGAKLADVYFRCGTMPVAAGESRVVFKVEGQRGHQVHATGIARVHQGVDFRDMDGSLQLIERSDQTLLHDALPFNGVQDEEVHRPVGESHLFLAGIGRIDIDHAQQAVALLNAVREVMTSFGVDDLCAL